MSTWVWLVILGAAVALFALVWWSSGRARARGRGPENSLTDRQVEGVAMNPLNQRAGNGPLK